MLNDRMLDNISTLIHMAYLDPADHLYLGIFFLEKLEKHSNVQAVYILIKVVFPKDVFGNQSQKL